MFLSVFFFLRIRRPPISTRPDTLFPDTPLFRSLGAPVTLASQGAGARRPCPAGRPDDNRPVAQDQTGRGLYRGATGGDRRRAGSTGYSARRGLRGCPPEDRKSVV